MEKYEKLELEVISFSDDDVIRTSGGSCQCDNGTIVLPPVCFTGHPE